MRFNTPAPRNGTRRRWQSQPVDRSSPLDPFPPDTRRTNAAGLSDSSRSADNPFQCYLTAIGRIPLLSLAEERDLTRRSSRLRTAFRRMLLSSPQVLRSAVEILKDIRAGKRRIDRTLEFGVSDSVKRRQFEAILAANLPTLEHLLGQQPGDEFLGPDRDQAIQSAPEIRRRLRRRRRKAIQLVEELQLRMACFQELDAQLVRHAGCVRPSSPGTKGVASGPGHALRHPEQDASLANVVSESSRLHWPVSPDRYLRRLGQVRRSYEAVVDKLVSANLRLVVSIAKRYPHAELELPDLVQEGNLGLLLAADKFDSSRGCKFATYATWWIRQAILCALTDKGRAIRVPASARDRLARLAKFQGEWRSSHGRTPTIEETEAATNFTHQESQRFAPLLQPTVSLDQPLTYHGDEVLGDFLADDHNENPLRRLDRETCVHQAAAVQRDLNSKERLVIGLRFGLIDGRDRSLAEVGRTLSVSRERARQIEAAAMQKMRACGATLYH